MAHPMYWILRGRVAVPVDAETWRKEFKIDDLSRRVAATDIGDDIFVSTIFMGLNCEWRDEAPVRIFETMVFGGKFDGDRWHSATWADAEELHAKVVRMVTTGEPFEQEDDE